MSKWLRRLTRGAARVWLGSLLVAQVPMAAQAQSGTTSADSITSAETETRYVRGTERAEQHGGSAARSVLNGILFVPRVALDGVLFATTQTAQLVDDAKLVSRTSAFFFGDDRTWVWYPALLVGTGAGVGGGAFVSYRGPRLTTTFGGIYGGTERFEASIRLDKEFETGSTLWHVQASGKVRKRPDLEFYGFGADPLTDPRNSFSPDATAPFGIYKQRLTKAQLIVGMRPSPVWEFFTTSYFLDRDLEIPSTPDTANFDQTFVPGSFGTNSNVRQLYNEVAVRLDTRRYQDQIEPGFRAEAYGGFSFGIGGDDSRFARYGIDAAAYIPFIKQTRVIVPRVIVDVLESVNDAVPVPFTEYPRHLTFRGASPRTILRTDEVMVQPSLEYQWPLAQSVRAHLFIDYLLVSQRFPDLSFTDALYAYGFGFSVHSRTREVGRFSIASGSEGVRILFTIGLTRFSSERSKWE